MSPRRVGLRAWESSVRRAVRDYVREHGMVPSHAAFASGGVDSRRVEMFARLDLLPGRASQRDAVVGYLARHRSVYGGIAKMVRGQGRERGALGYRLVLVVADESGVRSAQARAGSEGLGAWERLGDDVDLFGVVEQIREGLR